LDVGKKTCCIVQILCDSTAFLFSFWHLCTVFMLAFAGLFLVFFCVSVCLGLCVSSVNVFCCLSVCVSVCMCVCCVNCLCLYVVVWWKWTWKLSDSVIKCHRRMLTGWSTPNNKLCNYNKRTCVTLSYLCNVELAVQVMNQRTTFTWRQVQCRITISGRDWLQPGNSTSGKT